MAARPGSGSRKAARKSAPAGARRRLRRSYVWAVVFMAAIGAWFASGDVIVGGSQDNAVRQPAATVAAEPERRFRVRTRTYAAEPREAVLVVRGRTEAEARVDVKAETAGMVREPPAAKGARVEAGDLLCRLETGARQAAVNEAKAMVAQAQLDHEAAEQLAERGHAARLRVAAEQAKLDAARAALERAELELARTRLAAPFAGVVEDRPARVGTYLGVGDVCARLVALDPLTVVGAVSERQIRRIETGMAGEAELVTGDRASGVVTFIAPAADPRTRTFRIELEIANPNGALRDGVTADLRIPLQSEPAHQLAPAALTLNDVGQVGVRIVDNGDTVRFVPVTLLGEAEDGVWVAGLPPTAEVIVVGQEYVIDGQKVEAVNESGMAAR